MGRPSKLSEKQWEEIRKRLIAGEKASALAKEFKVSRANLSERFSESVRNVKNVAGQIVATEQALQVLSVPEQITALSLADELRAISTNLAGAAKNGSMTAFRLSGIAAKQVEKVDPEDPMESQETLQAISALTKMSNDAARLGMNLINANKDVAAASLIPPAKNKTIRIVKAEEMQIER